jgi:tripartite-type tricarboxylate transporter receptor subunit TctC
MNNKKRVCFWVILCAVSIPAFSQVFPTKPIQLVVPYPAGGPLDLAARTLAEVVRPSLGAVVVENRTGAGGAIGAQAVARSVPDGHTILMGAVATHAINPAFVPKMLYDPIKDFTPLTLVANVPNVLVLETKFAANSKIETLADFVEYLKRNPGRLSFGSGGNGSAGHLAGELLKDRIGGFAVHIPYRGAGPAQVALLSGEVQFMFDNLASAAPRIRDGKLKALALTSKLPSEEFPLMPTISGSKISQLRDFEITTWFGLFAPAGTPRPALDRLHQEFVTALKSKQFSKLMEQLAATASPSTPEEFAKLIAIDANKYRSLIQRAKLKLD